jgi:hypothetical protein
MVMVSTMIASPTNTNANTTPNTKSPTATTYNPNLYSISYGCLDLDFHICSAAAEWQTDNENDESMDGLGSYLDD